MNKTLMERARSMLSGAVLGQEFWAEAVDTACYLVNRSPSSTLEDKTPQKYGLGYKLWNPVTRKVVYNRDVVFKEVKYVIKHEVQPKELEKIDFDLKEDESYSTVEEESEDEEPQTPNCEGSSRFRGMESSGKRPWLMKWHLCTKNEAWDLVELRAGRKPIGSKWVFKKKTNAEGKVEKYKARLVAKG
eukprot:PITA_06771